jgi:phosphoglycerate dehydrogenase-like enzyme
MDDAIVNDAEPLRIVVLDDYQGVAPASADWGLIPRPVELESVTEHISDRTQLVERLRDASVVVAMRERTALSQELLEALPSLELIVTTGPSNAVIDVAAAEARGIEVRGTGGQLTPTSELTWGLILSLLRFIPAEDRRMREGGWQHTLGTDLAGRVLGIVGLGRLGSLVARVGKAFEMDVVTWSQNLDPKVALDQGVRPVTRHELFETADVVTVHLVLSERSRGLIGPSDLASMKPTAIFVNTSRGPIVDEDALVEALTSRSIAGAGLDVYDVEPLPVDHPLRSLPNTVLTPHIGYVTDGLYQQFYVEIVEDIAAWVRGEKLRNVSSA